MNEHAAAAYRVTARLHRGGTSRPVGVPGTTVYSRRSVLIGLASATAASAMAIKSPLLAARNTGLAPPAPFSFDALTREVQASARGAYVEPPRLPQAILDRLDYDALGKIHFDPACALFGDGPGTFPVTFFHVGKLAPSVVRMYALSGTGDQAVAREVIYDPGCFRMPIDSPAHDLPRGAGFSGFRFQESRAGDQKSLPWQTNDWVAFLGASYFRAIGELLQYGISARGIAINLASPGRGEEFPSFTRFYFEPPREGTREVTVYAVLDGPSVAGAYRFVMQRTGTVIMEIEARLFFRRDVAQLGIAPLTSMYWFSEATKPAGIDWRPEVHDSDGLALWTQGGEHVWRPLNLPTTLTASAFGDEAPRGFGLLQRDRNFDHYLDGVRYERRPSAWVEPLDAWGRGSVILTEAPTDDEIQDNVTAMWVPHEPVKAGAHLQYRYRLYWNADEPFPSTLARCVATRLGRGGQPGQPRPRGVQKFMVEFQGGPLTQLPFGVVPELVLSAPSGRFSYVFAEAVPDGVSGHWRAQFDFTPASPEVVELRLFLRSGERTLSETWLYQYRPT